VSIIPNPTTAPTVIQGDGVAIVFRDLENTEF